MVETLSSEQKLLQELRSFVTFALAMKPAVVLGPKAIPNEPELTLTISTNDCITEEEIASLEPLMAKYEPLKTYLDAFIDSEESITTSNPSVNFEPNVHYRLVRISGEQYQIAKEVATRLRDIHAAYAEGDLVEARREYDSFHQYLSIRRKNLIGEFRGVQFSNAIASYGVDRASRINETLSDGGLVIFVVVEIFIV